MARMTTAQLMDENARLRHALELMRNKFNDFVAQRIATEPCVVGDVFAIDRSRPAPRPGDEVVVATYTKRDGTRWDKVRVGRNKYVHRQVACP